jgi:hypothetical protein
MLQASYFTQASPSEHPQICIFLLQEQVRFTAFGPVRMIVRLLHLNEYSAFYVQFGACWCIFTSAEMHVSMLSLATARSRPIVEWF